MIALITPTGGRQKQIELCAKFMKNQTYEGKVLWIIVDDGKVVTTNSITEDFRDNWTIIKLYPTPKWSKGDNTQARNLLEGLNVIEYFHTITAIFIIEDDDYYCPQYLEIMTKKLEGYKLVGQRYTIYYHITARAWLENANTKHSSLFQVAFTPDLIPSFRKICKAKATFIDINFFREVDNKDIYLFNGAPLAVGIKGMDGRAGIGMGHRRAPPERVAEL